MQQGRHLADVAGRSGGAFLQVPCDVGKQGAVTAGQAVALLRDREGSHLQGRCAEDLHKTAVLGLILAVEDAGLRDGADDGLLDAAVALKGDQDAQVVVGTVLLGDDLIVEALRDDDAAVQGTGLKLLLYIRGVEGAEDVAGAEVHPERVGLGGGDHGLAVISGQMEALGFPGRSVLQSLSTQL